MNKVRQLATAWEAKAINECREDPELAALEASGKFCISCMMDKPCLCDWRDTLHEMREFYEKNRRVERKMWWGGTAILRPEPQLNLSWGEKGDALMDGLYRIATKRWKAARL